MSPTRTELPLLWHAARVLTPDPALPGEYDDARDVWMHDRIPVIRKPGGWTRTETVTRVLREQPDAD